MFTRGQYEHTGIQNFLIPMTEVTGPVAVQLDLVLHKMKSVVDFKTSLVIKTRCNQVDTDSTTPELSLDSNMSGFTTPCINTVALIKHAVFTTLDPTDNKVINIRVKATALVDFTGMLHGPQT